jgi:hypothetical protein
MMTAAQEQTQREYIMSQVRFINACADRVGAEKAVFYMPMILRMFYDNGTPTEACEAIDEYVGSEEDMNSRANAA